MTTPPDGCAEHGEVGEELRLLVLALLDRFEPGTRAVLAGLRVEAAEAAAADRDPQPVACQWCPLCSLIALLRGDRPELAGRIAEHAGGLLTALRALLEQPSPTGEPSRPSVQRIEVRQTGDGSHGPDDRPGSRGAGGSQESDDRPGSRGAGGFGVDGGC